MFWQGKRVFLTGHTGFKGAWLSLWLHMMGAEVTGYALAPPTTPSLYDLTRTGERIHSHIANVRDFKALTGAMRRARPDIAIHMAAQSLVLPSYEDPVHTYGTNVMGTVHFLEAVRLTPGVRAVLAVTSDKCYQNTGETHIESDPMGGYSPYASSKGCAELTAAAYRESFFHPGQYGRHGVALATARAGNVIGGGDWAVDRLLPDCARALEKGEPIPLRHPDAARPWQHVLDCLYGYLSLLEKLYQEGPAYAQAFNFGPEDTHTAVWVAERVCSAWGQGASYEIHAEADAPHEDTVLRLDSTKAREMLSWQPRLSMEEAVAWTVDWYRRYREISPVSLCEGQIRAYMDQGETP